MPPSYIKTVKDVIYYYYSKLVIAPAARLRNNYGFIIHTFKKLRNGEIKISDYDREILKQMNSTEKQCAYCNEKDITSLTQEHVIPLECGGPKSPHNIIFVCKKCNSSKGSKDLIKWWTEDLKKKIDDLPRIPAGLYLKLCYDAHKLKNSLDSSCNKLVNLWPFGKSSLYGRK